MLLFLSLYSIQICAIAENKCFRIYACNYHGWYDKRLVYFHYTQKLCYITLYEIGTSNLGHILEELLSYFDVGSPQPHTATRVHGNSLKKHDAKGFVFLLGLHCKGTRHGER